MTDIPSALYCENHPTRETSLRCNRCEKPICAQCAVLTPTGYRCRECVRGHQKVFETVRWYDYPVAFLLALVISYTGSLVASMLFFFAIFLAPVVGVMISEVVRSAVRRRRSRLLFRLTAFAIVLGALPLPALSIILALSAGRMPGNLLGLAFQVIYIVLATSTAYYRLSGIQMR
jgi:hypothetical protein